MITAVFPKHADVLGHRGYTTLKDVEDKKAKKEEREEEQRMKVKEMGVRECWKPWQASIGFFEGGGGRWVSFLFRGIGLSSHCSSTSILYTLPEIKTLVNEYIVSHNLVNPNDRSYINIDELLLSTLSSKTDTEPLEFLKRDDLMRRLVNKMQAWHEISVEGKEPVIKWVSIQAFSNVPIDQ